MLDYLDIVNIIIINIKYVIFACNVAAAMHAYRILPRLMINLSPPRIPACGVLASS